MCTVCNTTGQASPIPTLSQHKRDRLPELFLDGRRILSKLSNAYQNILTKDPVARCYSPDVTRLLSLAFFFPMIKSSYENEQGSRYYESYNSKRIDEERLGKNGREPAPLPLQLPVLPPGEAQWIECSHTTEFALTASRNGGLGGNCEAHGVCCVCA